MTAVGGVASGGWEQVDPGAGASGAVAARVLAVVLLLLVLAGGALLVRRLSQDPLRPGNGLIPAGIPGRAGLDAVRVTVGPWPEPVWRPTADVVVVLLSGGPLPVDADGEIRWVTDGQMLHLGPGSRCMHRVRPLRTSGVWMSLAAPGASPVRDTAVRP